MSLRQYRAPNLLLASWLASRYRNPRRQKLPRYEAMRLVQGGKGYDTS